jgi:hypothetical protein
MTVDEFLQEKREIPLLQVTAPAQLAGTSSVERGA